MLRLYQPLREQDEIIFSQGLYQYPREAYMKELYQFPYITQGLYQL
jgi:hypothetical protein